MVETRTSVILEVKNRAARDGLEQIIASMEEFRLSSSLEPSPCDLLIMEIGDDLDKELQLVRTIQESGHAAGICLTSTRNDPNLLLEILRSGAQEFIPQPIRAEEVRRSLASLREKLQSRGQAKQKSKLGEVVNLVGGKGGVGTTTVAVNLATTLMELKGVESVALIDMNLFFGEVPLFLDSRPNFNWGEVVENISRLDSTYLMSILTRHSSGIHILPSPTGLEVGEGANPSVIEKLLRLMRQEFDYVVIDSGQPIDGLSLKILELSSTVLVVAIPSLPCLINVRRLLDTFRDLGYPPAESVKIVMNRYHKKSVISLKDAQEGVDKEISWVIPNDYLTTMAAINQGKTLSEIARGEAITKKFKEFAEGLVRKENPKKERRTAFGFEFAKRPV